MSDQFKVSLVRGVISALAIAGGSFFGQLSTGGTLRSAGIAAGVAFFGVLVLRGGIEGWLDTSSVAKS